MEAISLDMFDQLPTDKLIFFMTFTLDFNIGSQKVIMFDLIKQRYFVKRVSLLVLLYPNPIILILLCLKTLRMFLPQKEIVFKCLYEIWILALVCQFLLANCLGLMEISLWLVCPMTSLCYCYQIHCTF